MARGRPAQRHDVVRPHQLLRDRADGRRRARAVARGRPARVPARRRHPGEPRQPARRGQGGEAPALRQPALRQRPHRRLRRGVPRGPPLPPPDDRLDGGPRRREPGRRPRVLPRATTAPTTRCSPCAATSRRRTGSPSWSATSATCRRAPRRAGPTTRSSRRSSSRCASSGVEVVPNDRLHVAFRLPVDETDDFIAAAVALDCIGGLATSRLVRRLVRREQTALGAHATRMGVRRRRLAGLRRARRRAGHRPRRRRGRLRRGARGLPRARARPPSSWRPSLAQSERSWLSALASQEERADLISHHPLLHDDPDVVNTHLDRLRDVTAEQVVEAARRWLRPDSRATVAYLVADDASDAETATTEDVA